MKHLPGLVLLLLLTSLLRAAGDPLAEPRRLTEERHHRAAEALLLEHLSTEREDEAAWKLLADVYLRMERPSEARRCAERARAIAPEDPEAQAALWEARLSEGGWSKEARAALERDVDAFLASTGTERWRLTAAFLGYQLLDAKRKKAALRERILRAMPEDPPEALEGDLLEAVIVTREREPRIDLIRQFLALFPGSKQANYLREIWLYMVREDRPRLFRTATGMLAGDPRNRRVRAALGRWLIETDPPDPGRALYQLREALRLLGAPREIDRPELMSDGAWRAELERTRGKYLALIGRAELLQGRVAEAIGTLTRASAILGHDVQLYLALGDAHAAAGHADLAVQAWERSAESGPSPEAEERLGSRAPPRWFRDVTEQAGLKGAGGSRIAAGDVNGDGWPDLLFGGRKLYLNDGDGTFTERPLPAIRGARGGLLADLDNDGDRDLLVFRTGPLRLFENDGAGNFTDRTPPVMREEKEHRTEAAAVLDFDGDGFLDLYEANYERPPTPPWARGTPDRLWRNRGRWVFEDASDALTGISAEPMCGRGAAPADFDDDGDTDLFVANYRLDPDYLYVNDGKGRLVDRAGELGVRGECDEGYFGHGIGAAWGDLNGDGRLDLVVGNLAHPRYIGFSDVTRIYLRSDGGFTDTFPESGVRYEETHSNPSLADVDLDGDLDLYLTSVYRGRWSYLYENDGTGKFRDVTWRAGVRIDNGWGSIFADVDLDGDPDLLVRTSQGMKLFENVHARGGYLGLELVGGTGNGGAIGARVTLSGPGVTAVREVGGGTGTGCQDDPSLRFGVGKSKGPFTLSVRWPDGRLQRIMGVRPGVVYRLREGANLERIR